MTTPNSKTNLISNLIRLVDDRDEFVRKKVREQLINLGDDAVPFLEIAAKTENLEVKLIVLEIIKAIAPKQLLEKFKQLAKSSPSGHWDLETGVTFLQEFGYPDKITDDIVRSLDLLAKEAFDRTKQKSPKQAVEALTHYLFFEKGFEGNTIDFLNPDNTYFSRMLKQKKGKVINITSIVAHTGNVGQANYSASKAGIIGFSKSLAIEYAKKNININCISPGFIETDMTNEINEEFKKLLISKIPSGNLGKPIDVANCAAFLSSDMSDYITGETIHVNGGI